MRIGFRGQLEDQKEIRAGFIGCGSHAFRNVFPCFQFTPVNLAATCDVDADQAASYARKFGCRKKGPPCPRINWLPARAPIQNST